MAEQKYNRLINEKSPYLKQHAANPVDWYPWGREAFEKAAREDKPIFLSIGYSACHWCHVMEKESFNDREVARLLNNTFINIKVDREERPEVDKAYMAVAQILSNTSGWPLTIIMTPDRKPFFAATYIPKNDRYGRVGLVKLIGHIRKIWDEKRNEINKTSDKLISALTKASDYPSKSDFSQSLFNQAYRKLEQDFDQQHGGFSSQPKFPIPSNLLFLLRYGRQEEEENANHMVNKTLQHMRMGGIWDHAGYGFHRYSTDGSWKVPHFEKMLYDQALISMAYMDAFLVTSDQNYRQTAKDAFTFVLRDLTQKEGGFYASVDADSEGEEGKYYLWTKNEIADVLEKENAEIICTVFNITEEGNLGQEEEKKNILYRSKSLDELSGELKLHKWELEEIVSQSLEKLFLARRKRKHPAVDKKILTDWNGLMIAALSRGARIFDRPIYTEEAKKAADFIISDMLAGEELGHCWLDGLSSAQATIEDYSNFIYGLIELYQATFNLRYLKLAYRLQQKANELFWDDENGGFLFSPKHSRPVVYRLKESNDAPIPSGNSVALHNLLRLSKLTSNQDFMDMGQRIIQFFTRNIGQMPEFHTFMLYSAYLMYYKTNEVVICGQSYSQDTLEMIREINKRYLPNTAIIFKPSEQDNRELDKITGFTEKYIGYENKATAYVCSDFSCRFPTTDKEKMLELLGQ
ncbi:MAG: thioredoxin domain-containing protein [Actinomycetota bacterium]